MARFCRTGADPLPAALQTRDQSQAILDLRLNGLALGGTPVLGQIDLRVDRSETLALVGPSGVGKTSLLRIIGDLEDRYSGTCEVAGRVAMVFQEPTLMPWRNLRDNLCIAAEITPEAAMIALTDVGLGARADQYPHTLSLGQQRRLSLARAFAVKPDLLLMDEPFVSLDPELVQGMMALFATLRSAHDVTTILVTHVASEAEQLASRIVTLGGVPGEITSDR